MDATTPAFSFVTDETEVDAALARNTPHQPPPRLRPHHRPVTPKSRRRQLAKSEFLLLLGVTVDRWRREVTDNEPGCLPFAQWPGDDPMRSLAHTYDLTPTDLAKVLSELGTEMETRAMRAGYEDTWAREDAPTPTEGPNASPKLAPTPVDGEDQDR